MARDENKTTTSSKLASPSELVLCIIQEIQTMFRLEEAKVVEIDTENLSSWINEMIQYLKGGKLP